MNEIPYLGLEPFSEENAPFFFGRDEQKRAIARSLRVSRLTVLFGESGVGKSSILRAGVVPLFRRDAEQNYQESRTPQSAVVVFRNWHGENPLQELLEKIRASVAKAMGIKPTDLEDEPTPAESLQVWTKILGGEEGRGQLFLILDQFEEYFQYHPQESGQGTFADEFPRWVNRSDLRVNFLIAMRQDALAKLHRFQYRILNIFDNQIELKRLDRPAARDAIVKPIGEYNLRQIIADHLETSRLTVLSAASGMGKSAVLRAIADKLRVSITFRNWRGNPVTDLIQQINADLKARFPSISVPEPGTSLTETLQQWVERIAGAGGNSRLFIILDQFEEFFQYQPREMGGSFVAEFSQAVNDPKLRSVHFLISIRDEARDLLKHFQAGIPGIFDHLLQIKQLRENPEIADLVKPIEEPAQEPSKAINIEPELVEEVLNQLCALSRLDLIGTAGKSGSSTSQENLEIEAPLLQLVMERLWKEDVEQKRYHCLCLKTLNELSLPDKKITGTQRIANDHLSDQMKKLLPEQQDAMAIVFKYLVSAGGTKIAYPILDLPESTKLGREELVPVLAKLDDKRILRTVKGPNPETKLYEIFHDILAWPILNWRDRYLLDKTLKEEEKKGQQTARERIFIGSLIGGGIVSASLVVAWILAAIYFPYVNRNMKDIQAAEYSIKEAEKIFKSELRTSGQIVGLKIAMQAGQQLSESLNRKLLTGNPTLSESINSFKKPSISTLQKMLKDIHEKNILEVTDDVPILSVILSSDGQLNTVSADGYVRRWNLQGEKKDEFLVSKSPISSVSFSGDGQMLVIGSIDGYASLWDLQEKKQRKKFLVSRFAISSVSFSSDGQMLALPSADGSVSLWDLHEQKPSVSQPAISRRRISSVRFSPKGQMLALGSADGSVSLWNLQGENKEKEEFLKVKSSNSPVPVNALSFSSNGKMLAIGSADGSVSLWNLQGENKEKEEFLNFKFSGKVNDISFSPDGKLLATVSDDGTVRLWDIQGEKHQVGNSLDEMLESGCTWLKDYFNSNPQERKNLSSICQNK